MEELERDAAALRGRYAIAADPVAFEALDFEEHPAFFRKCVELAGKRNQRVVLACRLLILREAVLVALAVTEFERILRADPRGQLLRSAGIEEALQALARAAEDVGARVHGPVTQGDFLKRVGIDTRAAALMQKATPEVATDISVALKRLTDTGRSGMGSMFKVLGISEPRLTGLAGLSDLEQAGGN